MDYVKKFDLELDREFYYAGEKLTGRVLIDSAENMRVQCIKVMIKAKTHVEWKVTRSGERKVVKEDDVLLENKIIVWGKEAANESSASASILPRGFHQYPFEFQLPETSQPCSFESKAGTIRYYLKVIIDIPYACSPQGIKYFTLIGPYIDCMDEKFLTQLRADEKVTRLCLCCRKVPISMEAVLERSAYCSGEKIRLVGSVVNNSNDPAYFIVRMFQNVDYIVSKNVLTATKSVEHKVLEYISDPIKPKTKAEFADYGDKLELPVMPPTLVNVCRNIEITYSLKVTISRKKVDASDIEVDFPFTVATVPYRVPSKPMPQITYAEAAKNVEGGMYVSPEFQLGQVYDGTFGDSTYSAPGDDLSVLYRPVYTTTFTPSEQTAVAMSLMAGDAASLSGTGMLPGSGGAGTGGGSRRQHQNNSSSSQLQLLQPQLLPTSSSISSFRNNNPQNNNNNNGPSNNNNSQQEKQAPLRKKTSAANVSAVSSTASNNNNNNNSGTDLRRHALMQTQINNRI